MEELIETREELMVSDPINENPTLRTAYFLGPKTNPINDPPSSDNLHSCSQNYPLELKFNGWNSPQRGWDTWIDSLEPKYRSTWKKVGIYNAIQASKCEIAKNRDIVLNLAERWFPNTNTFVFPWGEATITLEDLTAFGYSVLGFPVFAQLETEEEKRVEEKLEKERKILYQSSAKKASHTPWLNRFMESDREIEHEAFLALWLSRFVFPGANDTVVKYAIPIAIRLSRGIRIALAPAVLASIYRDLTLLKSNGLSSNCSSLTLNAPFQLVQVWVWERFKYLQPNPNLNQLDDPRLARWDKVKPLNNVNVSQALEQGFRFRPYATLVNPNGEMGHSIILNENLLFLRCLRAGELVGIDCIEQYCPNRVARQFRYDQDIPNDVPRFNDSPETAWEFYTRPIKEGSMIYVPFKKYKPEVTLRYLKWCKKLVSDDQSLDNTENLKFMKKRIKDNDSVPPGFTRKNVKLEVEEEGKKDNDDSVPHVFTRKNVKLEVEEEGKKDNDDSVPHVFTRKNVKLEVEEEGKKDDDESVPPVFTCKNLNLKVEEEDDEDKFSISEFMRARAIRKEKAKATDSDSSLVSPIGSSSAVENRDNIQTVTATEFTNKSMQCKDVGNTAVDLLGWELEQKINRLERIVDVLKMPKYRKKLRRAYASGAK